MENHFIISLFSVQLHYGQHEPCSYLRTRSYTEHVGKPLGKCSYISVLSSLLFL